MRKILQGFAVFLAFGACINAFANTYTVCDGGSCDYLSISGASGNPGMLPGDTIELTSDYLYDEVSENYNIYIPDSITLTCDPGADTIGDSALSNIQISPESNSIIENCTFDNVHFEPYAKSNITIRNNTFVPTSNNSRINVQYTDGYTISDNTAMQELFIAGSDNGTISNNTFECRNNNSCLYFGGNVNDFNDPAQISDSVVISGNTFTNYSVSGYGDWVSFASGTNITFSDNIIQAGLTVDNHYLTLLTIQNTQVEIMGNTVLMPEKSAPADQSTWAFNIRIGTEPIDADIHNNTIIFNSQGTNNSGCIGTQDGGHSLLSVTINYSYNLCYNGSGTKVGNGINLQYDNSITTMNFTESYNGFYGIENLIYDSNGVITELDTTTLTSNPILRLENIDTADDATPAPMSGYLDINGTIDIGASSLPRINTYTIDDNCIVDYLSCFSQYLGIVGDVIRSGDAVTIGDGTYNPLILPSGLDDISLEGTGATTIIDASGGAQAFSLNGITNSTVKNFSIQNATTPNTAYHLFSLAMSYAGTDYDTIGNTGLYAHGSTCSDNLNIVSPFVDATGVDGIGTSDIGLFLIKIPDGNGPGADLKITVLLPNSSGRTPAEIETNCGQPAFLFQTYVTNALILQPDGTYVFNASAVSDAGITILGDGSNPFLTKIVTPAAGMYLGNATGNMFSNLSFSGNALDIYLDTQAGNNTFTNMIMSSGNAIESYAAVTNALIDPTINLSNISMQGTGDLNISYSFDATLRKAIDSSPLEGADITIKDKNGTIINTLTSDSSGIINDTILTTILTTGGPLTSLAGNINPLTFIMKLTGYLTQSFSSTLTVPFSLSVSMTAGEDPVAGSGGGGGAIIFPLTPSTITNTLLSDPLKLIPNTPPPSQDTDFTDTDTSFAKDDIIALFSKGIIKGYEDNTFRPENPITRAEFLAITMKSLNIETGTATTTSYTDIPTEGSWMIPLIEQARLLGIAQGQTINDILIFRPNDSISRGEAVTMLLNAAKIAVDLTVTTTQFSDIPEDSQWMIPYIEQARFLGIIQGQMINGIYKFRPNDSITRAEGVRVVNESANVK